MFRKENRRKPQATSYKLEATSYKPEAVSHKLFLALLLLLAGSAQAQYDPARVGKKAMGYYGKAMDAANDLRYPDGIAFLKQAVDADPKFEDGWLSMAGMYGELKNYRAAVDAYDRARAIDSVYFKDYDLPYSINLAGLGEFARAKSAADEFLSIPNLNETSRKAGEFRQKSYAFALDYLATHKSDYRFEPLNLGDSINSAVSEYYPTITLDGSKLVYTRRVGNTNEDFFESNRTASGWSKARALVGNINSNDNEGAQNISQDGQWLLFTGCNFPEGFGSCDLYISYLTPDGWSAPENLGRTVNSEFWDAAPSLSPDKRDLYFTSRRTGGYGGNDLWVSHRNPDGRWGEPENMGPTINTPGDESAPFIHADNQSLYFTSNGLTGFGGDDLFVTRKQADGTWSKPENLGYPINTIENEGSLVVAADGKTAYYASDRADSRGGLDIYTFELRDDVRPARTLWVKGKVFDKKTGKGLPSLVQLTDLASRQTVSQVQTDETGNYLTTLPLGKDYAFSVARRGYLFYSANFPFGSGAPDSTYQADIPMQPLEPNASVTLRNIFFDVNKFDLKSASQVELDEVVRLMTDNKTLSILISGHTDNVGKSADNLQLSENRARAVVNYLVSKGIAKERLQARGFGDTKPVADNATEAGRAQNRRTELTITKV